MSDTSTHVGDQQTVDGTPLTDSQRRALNDLSSLLASLPPPPKVQDAIVVVYNRRDLIVWRASDILTVLRAESDLSAKVCADEIERVARIALGAVVGVVKCDDDSWLVARVRWLGRVNAGGGQV